MLIERQGDAVILRPKPVNKQAWRVKMEAVVSRVVLLFILHFTGTFMPVCITAKWGNAVE